MANRTAEKCYGSFIGLFPGKIKNWLLRNKTGSMIGFFLGAITLIMVLIDILFKPDISGSPFAIIVIPFAALVFIAMLFYGGFICHGSKDWGLFFGPDCSNTELIIIFILNMIILTLAGAFLQSLLRRIFRGRW